ncbi:serine/arginine repetitive matrix protein 2-like isoform X2 [Haliotis rufescens]|uniref:serine/arginine repetitive matrix protein 2-like isoform X2 n=1 Tax=Haliotis rufescens TaxID=6454 RepID=UPI00201E9D94|nr:serine/arginine repetitive matrix protein 2-like isoform X2 [Haliotis rufescens]
MSSSIPPCLLSPQRDRAPDDSDMDLVSTSDGSPVIRVGRQNHTRRLSGSTIFTSSELTSDSCTTAPGKFTDSWSDSTDDLRGENICGRGRRKRSYSGSNCHAGRPRHRSRSMSCSRSPSRRRSCSRSNLHVIRRRRRSMLDNRSPIRQIPYSRSNSHTRRSRSTSGHRSPPRQRSNSGSNSHTRRSRSTSGHRSPPRRRSNSGSNSHERRSRSTSGHRSPPRQRSYSGSKSHERQRSRSISGHRSPPRRRSYSGSKSHERRRSRSISGHRSPPRRRSYSGSNSYARRRSRTISGHRYPPRQRSYSGSKSHERRRSRSISGHRSPPRRRSYSGSNSYARRRSRTISGHRYPPRRRSYSGSKPHERQRSRSISGHRSPPRRRSNSGSYSYERRRSRSISGHRSPPRRRSYSGSKSHERRRSRSISGHRSPPRQRSYSGSKSHERRRSRSISGHRSPPRRRSNSGSKSHERQRSRSTSGHRSPPRRRSYSVSNSYARRRSRTISGQISHGQRSYSGSYSHERRSRSISGNRSHRRQRSVSESPSSGGTKVTAQHIYVRRWSRKRSGSGSKSSSPDSLDVSGPTSPKKRKVSGSPTPGSDMTKTLNVKQILDEGKLSEMKRRQRASTDLQELNLTSSFEPSAVNISQPQTVGISLRTSQEKDQRDNTHVSERSCQLPSNPYDNSNLDIVSLSSYDSELPRRVSPVMKTTDMPYAPTLFSSNNMSVSLSGVHTAGHGQTGSIRMRSTSPQSPARSLTTSRAVTAETATQGRELTTTRSPSSRSVLRNGKTRSESRERSYSGAMAQLRYSTRQRSPSRITRLYSSPKSHAKRRRLNRRRSISGSNSSTRWRSYSGSNSHKRRRRRSISGSNSSTRRRSYSGSNSHKRRRRRSISGSNSSTRRRSYSGSNTHERRRRRRSISGSNSSTRRRSYSGSITHERRRRRRSISGSNSPTRRRSYSGSITHERRRRRRSISGSSQALVQNTSSQSSEPVDLELFPFVKNEDIKYFGRLLRSINLSSPGISQTEVEKRHLIGIVLKIKNGPPATAQEATTELQKMAKTGGCCELFNLLLPMIFHTLWQDEREETMQKLIESIDAVIYKAGGKARPYIDKLLLVFQAGLCGTRQMKLIACRMVSKLTKVFGTREILSHLTPDLDSPSAVVPNTNGYTVAIIAETAGLGAVLPYVKTLCDSELPAIKEAGFSTIQTIVHLLKKGVQPHIKPLMGHLQPDLQHTKFFVQRHWAEAVASVASMATKEDYPAFSAIWDHLLDRYRNNSQVLTVFEQSATFNIIFLKPSLTKEEHDIICDVFTKSCESPDERMRTNSAKMLCKLSLSTLVADDVFDQKFLRPFLQQSLLPSTAMTSHDQFCKICVRSARRLSAGKVCTYIVDGLFKRDGFLPVTDALAAILQKHGLSQITYHTERRIILGLMCAVKVQTFQSDDKMVTSIEKIIKLLRRRLCFHTQDIQQMLASATATSSAAQRSPLNQLLMNLQGLCSQDQMTSELVLDGCVRSMTECL